VKKLLLVFSALMFVSCAKLHIVSSKDQQKITFREKDGEEKPVKLVVEKNFYLWGLLPTKHELDIGAELDERAIRSLSGLKVSEIETDYNGFLSFISFGMFIPRTYAIEGFTAYTYGEDPMEGDAL
jgi:hypothetical protein